MAQRRSGIWSIRGGIGAILWLSLAQPGAAAELKILTAGAFKQVVLALVPDFERRSGHKVTVDNDTAGGLTKRIEGGEAFDVAVITPRAIDDLITKGKMMPASRIALATVGIGVVVKEGTQRPDISTVEAFKNALLAAKSVAYIDPASGGSSGIYLDKLFERIGIADQIRAKAKLKRGGYVADLIASGEAELGIHQISEIVPVRGVMLVGPLPKEIQTVTTYAGGLSSGSKMPAEARQLLEALHDARAVEVLKTKGMEPAGPYRGARRVSSKTTAIIALGIVQILAWGSS
ncbi:MAG: molybdate ABC transporter substrate-binding protein, partial [Pseudolabrys sp.]